MQTSTVLRMTWADTEPCVGPAPFRQAQGPEHVEGLVAGPQVIGKTVRRQAATLHRLHRSALGNASPSFSLSPAKAAKACNDSAFSLQSSAVPNALHPRHPPPNQIGQEHPPDHKGDGAGGGVEDEEGAAGGARQPPYAQLMADMLATVAGRADESFHPFLVQRPVRTRGIILVTTDKGLCGPLNGNLFKLVTEIREPAKFAVIAARVRSSWPAPGATCSPTFRCATGCPSGRESRVRVHGEAIPRRRRRHRRNYLAPVQEYLDSGAGDPALAALQNLQEAVANLRQYSGGASARPDDRPMLFEPNTAAVFSALLPLYVNREVYYYVLDAKASEHSARMVAMKTAKDNATKLIDDLTSNTTRPPGFHHAGDPRDRRGAVRAIGKC